MNQNRRILFRRLQRELPSLHRDTVNEDIELQARATLGYVIDPIVAEQPDPDIGPRAVDPCTCPNCGLPETSKRSPYCGENCRETAGFVRQFRSGLEQGWIFDAQKQVALGQVLWHVLGGGRPLRQQISPAKARQTALKREGGRCQVCGAPATTVDHIGSGCNRPINLRAVCDACCLDRPFGDPRVVEQETFSALTLAFAERIGSPIALRCCDDGGTWDWRAYLAKRHPTS